MYSDASFEALSRQLWDYFFLSFKLVKTLRKQPFNLLGNCFSSLLCFSEVTEWAELGFSLTTTKGKKSFPKTSLHHFFLRHWPSDASPWWCTLSTLKALLNIERKFHRMFAATWAVCGFVCKRMVVFLFSCSLINPPPRCLADFLQGFQHSHRVPGEC